MPCKSKTAPMAHNMTVNQTKIVVCVEHDLSRPGPSPSVCHNVCRLH